MDTQQQKSYKILVIGDKCEDVYHFGTCHRISPEAPVPILKKTHEEIRPGMSSNVVANLESFGVNCFHIANTNLIRKHRFVDNNFKQHLLRLDEGENLSSYEMNTSSFKKYKDLDAVVISDYNKGFVTHDNSKEICEIFNDIPIFVDTKKNNLSCFENTIIKINEKEKDSISKYPTNYELITTLGPAGATWKDIHFPATQTEVFDVCGAGDTFFAAFIFEYLETKDFKISIEFSNKCASLAVKKLGTYVPNKKEIEDIRNDICS